MFFTDISYVVHPVGRITPTGISLLGTAFFINKPGILATASHVVGNNDNDLVIIMNRINSIQDYQDTSNMQVSYVPAKIKEINPIYDVCLLRSSPNHSIHFRFNFNRLSACWRKYFYLWLPAL